MRFTDKDGREYKPTDGGKIPVDAFLIRPVKQEPKFEFDWKWKHDGITEVRVKVPDTNSTQARAIKEAVEALMEYVVAELEGNLNPLVQSIDKARQSMRENN